MTLARPELERVIALTCSDDRAVARRALIVLRAEFDQLLAHQPTRYIDQLLFVFRHNHWLAWWIVLDRRSDL